MLFPAYFRKCRPHQTAGAGWASLLQSKLPQALPDTSDRSVYVVNWHYFPTLGGKSETKMRVALISPEHNQHELS